MRKKDYLDFLPKQKRADFLLFLLPLFLTLFGILMIYEASNVAAFQSFSDKYHFVKEQINAALIGFLLLGVFSRINFRNFYILAIPTIVASIISLIIVLIPPFSQKILGARRWLDLGFISFQPSELAKISLILYLSSWLANKEKERFLPFIILLCIIVGLVILQPDLGTAIVLTAIFLIVYFLSDSPIWHFLILIPLTLASVTAVSLISPYRYQRLVTFLNPSRDPLGSSYHIRQILISIGSGGLFGLGFGASRQKYQYLPEATTDSIFAIIGEEFGFFGSLILIIAYLILLYRIFRVILSAPDKYSQLVASGIFSLLGSQILINLGSMVAIFPITGIPLPFISYGGSNLVITLAAIGILLNISKFRIQQKRS